VSGEGAVARDVAAVVGGTVVTPEGVHQADVLISDGKIAAIAEPGSAGRTGIDARLDAEGCYVLPGGVDPHCHLMSQVHLATAAAARGGTTTALSFTNPEPGQGDLESLLRRRDQLGRGDAVIDVGLHAMLYDPQHATFADLAAARQAGAAAAKVFLAYPELGIMFSTQQLHRLMTDARQAGLVVQVHCENGPLIETLMADAVRSGRRGEHVFADTRPPEVEEEAVARTLAVASLTGATCYLVHLSTAGALDQVRLARKRGRPTVYAEVCLHHLLLDDGRYAGPAAARFLVAPPLRAADHVEALWEAVADGTVDAIGSDHCQTRSAVLDDIAVPGESYEYGIAGIGARLPLLLSEGLRRGLPLERLVQLAAQNPARAFGHYPRKGALAPGSDADIVLFHPDGETVLGPDAFDDGTGHSVYAGLRVRGQLRAVLLRGRLIAEDGVLAPQPGRGRYLAADPAPVARAGPLPGAARLTAARRCLGLMGTATLGLQWP
jgi:dihydropyrimidinase